MGLYLQGLDLAGLDMGGLDMEGEAWTGGKAMLVLARSVACGSGLLGMLNRVGLVATGCLLVVLWVMVASVLLGAVMAYCVVVVLALC